jgi:phage terminase small subunit
MDLELPVVPIKLPYRQEQFCQHIHSGKSQTEAYKLAYGVSGLVAAANSSRMIKGAKVSARLAQIRADSAAASQIDLPFLTKGLLVAYRLGLRTNQSSAASQAMLGIAKLHGFLIEKHQIDAVVRRPAASPDSPDEMSESKWLQDYGPVLDLTLGSTAEPSTEGSASIAEGSDSIDQSPDSITQVQPEVETPEGRPRKPPILGG